VTDENQSLPTLGVIGFGAFGRLMTDHLRRHFRVLVYDPVAPDVAHLDGVTATGLAAAAGASVVVLATPVGSFASVIDAILPHLRPGVLVLDVGSVKVVPADIMRRLLPRHVDIVATHPLFGPQSARNGLENLKIALCPIRGGRVFRVAAFLRKAFKLKVIVTTPEAHDHEAAIAQGLTHLIAKVLVRMEPLPRRMTTKSFDLLVQAIEMVRHDAPEVFQAIERSNPYSRQVRRRFFDLAAELDAEIERSMPDDGACPRAVTAH
jgi:prephenate dehydrogenase